MVWVPVSTSLNSWKQQPSVSATVYHWWKHKKKQKCDLGGWGYNGKRSEALAHGSYAKIHVSTYAAGGQLTPTPEDIPEPSHGWVFCEKFHSVYVVKGVWSWLTDLFLNRHGSVAKTECWYWGIDKTSSTGQNFGINKSTSAHLGFINRFTWSTEIRLD